MSERAPPSFDRGLVEGPLASAIRTIFYPTLLQNAVVGLQGVVDHVMVGHFVGFEANAALGVSWQILIVVVVFIGSLYSGMGVLVARYAGAGLSDRVNQVVFQVFLVSLGIGVGILAPVGYLLSPGLLALVHAEPGVAAEALPYLRTMFVGGQGMMLFYMLAGALRAAGDAKTPLRLGVALTVINLGLNVILIPVFGTFGAALGTVTANAVVSGYAVWKLFTHRLVIRFSFRLGCRPDAEVLRSVLRFGLPTGLQAVVMNVGGVVLIRYVGSLAASAAAQAAYAVGYLQLFSFITWGASALMAAAATITGQNLGAGRADRATRTPLACSTLGLLYAVPVASAYLFFPEVLLGVFGMKDPEVLAIGGQLLAFLSVSGFFVTVALTYTGALQGAGDTRSPLYIAAFSQLALPIGMCAVLEATQGLEASDVWLAIVLGHVSRALLSVWRFRQGKWKDIEVS